MTLLQLCARLLLLSSSTATTVVLQLSPLLPSANVPAATRAAAIMARQIRRRCNSEVVLAPPAATGAEHAAAWLKEDVKKKRGEAKHPSILIQPIFRRLIIKLARKHSRVEIDTKI